MAYIKILPINHRLDIRIKYIENESKTTFGNEKFITSINCQPQNVYKEMMATKKRWKKESGVLAYHIIQSFSPGEITPEEAHKIGVEFSKILFAKDYEIEVCTHIDKSHIHNHIIFNSVSFSTGKKYHSNINSYYNQIQKVSNDLCLKSGYSIIEPKAKGKHYSEWNAEKHNTPTIRSLLKNDIDKIISNSYTYSSFLSQLEKCGYSIRYGKNIAIRSPDSQKYIRLKSLGELYTQESIKTRILKNRYSDFRETIFKRKITKNFISYPGKKIKGIQALYFKYLCLLQKARKRKLPNKAVFLLRKDLIQFEKYKKQFNFLIKTGIETTDDLESYIKKLTKDIIELKIQRKKLYVERSKTKNAEEIEKIQQDFDKIDGILRAYRKRLSLCKKTEQTVQIVKEKIQQEKEISHEEPSLKQKGVKTNEHSK